MTNMDGGGFGYGPGNQLTAHGGQELIFDAEGTHYAHDGEGTVSAKS